MKSNLAHEPPIPQGKVVRFPKKERQAMSNKDDGFTPLPNLICDEGYLTALSGEAVKCLILLNRHVRGFHLDQKAMGEALVMKVTGIKDKRTVRKCMAELAKFKLVSITKNMGKSSSYALTFDDRISVEVVASDVPSTSNAVTYHVTTPVASDVPSTSDMPCHSVKEIYLKENIKEIHTHNSEPENSSIDAVLDLWKPDLHSLNSWLQRSGERPMTQDQVDQILLEVNSHYEPRLKSGLVTSTQMYANFVKWVKRSKIGQRSAQFEKPMSRPRHSRNVNDAWKDQPVFEGTVESIEIPEDFV